MRRDEKRRMCQEAGGGSSNDGLEGSNGWRSKEKNGRERRRARIYYEDGPSWYSKRESCGWEISSPYSPGKPYTEAVADGITGFADALSKVDCVIMC